MRWVKTHSETPQLLGLSPLKHDDSLLSISTTQLSLTEYPSRDEMLTDMQKNSLTRKSRIGEKNEEFTQNIETRYANCVRWKWFFLLSFNLKAFINAEINFQIKLIRRVSLSRNDLRENDMRVAHRFASDDVDSKNTIEISTSSCLRPFTAHNIIF